MERKQHEQAAEIHPVNHLRGQVAFSKTIAVLFAPFSFMLFLTFCVFVFTHWTVYVAMTGTIMAWLWFVIVAGISLALAWLGTKVVLLLGHGLVDIFLKLGHGSVEIYHRASEARGQRMRNKVIFTCDDYSLIEEDGRIQMLVPDREKSPPAFPSPSEEETPLLPQTVVSPVPDRECLNLSPTFRPHANQILSGRGSIFGVPGSGKSVTVAVVSEELGRLHVPFLLADTEDEYRSLLPWLPHGELVDAQSLSVAQAEPFGRYLLENTRQVILNLASYETDDESALVMIGMIAGMREWEEERASEHRLSCMFLLDEASVWLPQNIRESRLSENVLAAMHTAFFADLVRRGRKRGMGFTLATQRIAEIDKRALQSNWRLLHRQTEQADLERYEKLGVPREDALSLGNGEVFVTTPQVSNQRTQLRMRSSPHGSQTPGLESIRRHQQDREISPKSFRITEVPRNGFEDAPKPLHTSSETSNSPVFSSQNPEKGVPEATKLAIIADHERGLKTKKGSYYRKEIQEHLGINGDEYWMIKAVLDEYEKERLGA